MLILLTMLVAQIQNRGIMPAPDLPQCHLRKPARLLHSLRELPPEANETFERFNIPMADAGQAFEPSDVITDPDLPSRRFIRGYRADGRWIVWFEHGGRGYHIHIIGLGDPQPLRGKNRGASKRMHAFADLGGDPCAATEALLNGVYSRTEQIAF